MRRTVVMSRTPYTGTIKAAALRQDIILQEWSVSMFFDVAIREPVITTTKHS